MDGIDLKIIDLLQSDARLTQQEVAKEVGLSQPSIADRIRKLEEAKVILGYTARIDPRRLGQDITAFIGVVVDHPKYFEPFERRVLALPEVLECHQVAGAESYLIKVRTKSTRTLDELLVERLRTIPGVARTETTIVLSSAKEGNQVFVGGSR